MNEKLKRLWAQVKSYFNIMPDKDDEQSAIRQMSSAVVFKGANLWVLICAIFIASLGLNVNSTAVIIGAMLISPLMGPIIGMGLAVGINDIDLLRRALKNFGVATAVSVLTAMLYFLITPLGEAQSELLARTSPTIYDVFIAFCGGMAGIIALTTSGKGNIIPGVAIATALMPPLCTAGYGLAMGKWLYFLGAFYLFFINTVFITLATYVGVKLLKFHPKETAGNEKGIADRRIIMGVVVLTMIPAVFMTINIVRKSIFDSNVRHFVKEELSQVGTQILSSSVDADSSVLNVVAVGRELSPQKRDEAGKRMHFYALEGYRLNVIQGTQSDSLLQLNHRLDLLNSSRHTDHQKVLEISAQASRLKQQLDGYTQLEDLSATLKGELQVLFPQVSTISLSRVKRAMPDSAGASHYVAAIVGTADSLALTDEVADRLRRWLKARVPADSLTIYQ